MTKSPAPLLSLKLEGTGSDGLYSCCIKYQLNPERWRGENCHCVKREQFYSCLHIPKLATRWGNYLWCASSLISITVRPCDKCNSNFFVPLTTVLSRLFFSSLTTIAVNFVTIFRLFHTAPSVPHYASEFREQLIQVVVCNTCVRCYCLILYLLLHTRSI